MPIYAADADSQASDAVRVQDGYENRLYLAPVLRGWYPADLQAAIDRESNVVGLMKPADLETIGAPIDLLCWESTTTAQGMCRRTAMLWPGYTRARWLGGRRYPAGLYDLLVRIKRDYGNIPLSITENGIPTNDILDARGIDDRERVQFLHEHIAAAHRAIQAGGRPAELLYLVTAGQF
jgi:beta-glucosidase